MNYTEIFRLKEKLEKAKIPFEFYDRTEKFSISNFSEVIHYQICYPNNQNRICSVIQGTHTYGGEKNLLEIMGLNDNDDAVEGYLSAEEVFDKIYEHWQWKYLTQHRLIGVSE